MPVLPLTTVVLFYNGWNVNKKDSIVKCDYFPAPQQHPSARRGLYSQLRSHHYALSNAPILSIRSVLIACLWSGPGRHWKYTVGSSFSDITSDSCRNMSHNDHKQQTSKQNVRANPNSQAFGYTSSASFIKSRTAIFILCSKAAARAVWLGLCHWEELIGISIFPKWSANAWSRAVSKQHNNMMSKPSIIQILAIARDRGEGQGNPFPSLTTTFSCIPSYNVQFRRSISVPSDLSPALAQHHSWETWFSRLCRQATPQRPTSKTSCSGHAPHSLPERHPAAPGVLESPAHKDKLKGKQKALLAFR